jgi:pimeloyl-ACP methyl ester carboxylesterase
MRPRLSPDEVFPAGVAGLSARFLTLRSGLRVRVVECGAADAPPVVLLSGWGGSVYLYRKNLAPLADAGLRAIAVDLKGQGLSDKPADPAEYTTASMTAHALEILDALGLARTRLVGQSMAGGIAARVALAAPERVERLVAIGAVGFGPVPLSVPLRPLPNGVLAFLSPVTPRWTFWVALRRAYGSLARPTARDVEEYYAPTSDPNFIKALFLLLHEFNWRLLTPEECARLRLPVLLIFGTEDHVVLPTHAERLAARLPDARLVMVPGAGHVTNEEAPDVVNRALVKFLAP